MYPNLSIFSYIEPSSPTSNWRLSTRLKIYLLKWISLQTGKSERGFAAEGFIKKPISRLTCKISGGVNDRRMAGSCPALPSPVDCESFYVYAGAERMEKPKGDLTATFPSLLSTVLVKEWWGRQGIVAWTFNPRCLQACCMEWGSNRGLISETAEDKPQQRP